MTSPVDAWIAHWQHHRATGKFPSASAGTALEDHARTDPDAAWSAILAVLHRIEADPADLLFQVLAAGPLENLLVYRGPEVIDRVETEARRNPRFRLLLGGVWPSSTDPAVWARVEEYRTQTW